jgi:hypothetical protein
MKTLHRSAEIYSLAGARPAFVASTFTTTSNSLEEKMSTPTPSGVGAVPPRVAFFVTCLIDLFRPN